jgi:hypothetical protein
MFLSDEELVSCVEKSKTLAERGMPYEKDTDQMQMASMIVFHLIQRAVDWKKRNNLPSADGDPDSY